MWFDYSEEVLNLCSINERFENEPEEVQEMRLATAKLLEILVKKRDKVWRSEAGRNYSIAITEAENSLMRAVKGFYSK